MDRATASRSLTSQLSNTPALSEAGVTVRLPGEIVVPNDRESGDPTNAQLLLRRRFNRPTGLDANQTVIVGFWSDAEVIAAWLNESTLAPTTLNFREPASSCYLLPVDRLAAYNSLGLVLNLNGQTRIKISQVALGIM